MQVVEYFQGEGDLRKYGTGSPVRYVCSWPRKTKNIRTRSTIPFGRVIMVAGCSPSSPGNTSTAAFQPAIPPYLTLVGKMRNKGQEIKRN